MAAGTWNQGRLEKHVTKIGLNNYPTIEFWDTSLTSDQIFNIIEFPNRLTAGKNLIKIQAANDILVKNSKVHIEILDSNGDPIYYEPLNYLEHDGTRVIAIHIFSDKTAPGIGTIYIGGRTKVNLNDGTNIPYSSDYNDENYLNLPNVLWSRNISIAPENSKNNTEIIFTKPYPKATVRERINRYFQPVNLSNVNVARSGSGSVIIKAIPSNIPHRMSSGRNISSILNHEGGASGKTVARMIGTMASLNPNIIGRGSTGAPETVSSIPFTTVPSFCRLETTGFALSSSMQGGTITITNPYIEVQNNTAVDSAGFVIPASQISEKSSTVSSGIVQLSGSYVFGIDTLLSTTKANVYQISGFKNNDENTYGAFNVNVVNRLQYDPPLYGMHHLDVEHNINNIKSTTNFTCSYVEPFVLSQTEQSQSFAEIILSDIEPATGDVHKIQTLYKPGGQFGDFIDAGMVELEQVEVLEDITSYESIPSIGLMYNRIGYFTSLSDFNSYWETSNGSVTPEVTLTTAYKPDLLLDGVELSPDTSFDSTSNRFGYLHLKSDYQPKVYTDTQYILSFNAVTDDTTYTSSDENVEYPRLDIYISGSNSSIETDSEYINRYLISDLDINNTLTGDLADNSKLGTRISTIELTPGSSYDETPVLANFKALKEENIDVYIVVRRGKWTVSNISLKSNKQTGFSPNYTRINTRIPSEYLETPLTFKFRYYDIHNNKAEAETIVWPVTFYGDNLVIAGTNNLLTGSVYIGNTTGAGIELAGVNSGYIRSIGYEGFKSASRTENPGGFMLYTGSVLPNAPDNYDGVGIEIVQDSSSYFKFDTTNGIDVRAKKFFIGTEDSQFVSGSTGNIEISSSNFHLKPDGGLVIGGDTVIDADLSVNNLFVPANTDHDDSRAYISSSGVAKFAGDGAGDYKVVFNNDGTATISGFVIDDTEIKSNDDNLRLKSGGQITGSNVKFDGGDIGGFALSSTALIGGSTTTTVALTPGAGIHMGHATLGSAPFSVTNEGVVKAQSGTIGGWTLASDRITGGSMIIRDNGTIESDGFVSNLAGSGFRLTAASGGFLEVENARIRGTLSTAVFEKETVNAVGGQLYVANSTTLTGSAENPGGSYTATDTTMSVVNASGFAVGEILSAKKINSTGFQTEYLKINSASRNNQSSDTDYSGKIYVTRAYGSGTTGDSGSLGNTPGGAQAYTGSQVIVSTGKIGTGYIRLNANPNDQATPYMQIVERTGSGIYDLDLKAQLGDLSGITDNINGTDVTGFGLYTDNAFLKGGIVATYGSIGALNIGSQSISIGVGAYDNSNTKFFVSSSGKFSLGDKLSWDGTDLSIQGSITITNPGDFVQPSETGSMLSDATSGLLNVSETGSMLSEATAGLVDSSQTGSFTQNSATSSLTNPATYEFGGNGFTLGTHTPSTGLNMNADFLGYFNSTTPKTFMSSSGDFYLGGTGGAFKWDESEGSLLVSGSSVSMNVPTFYFGGTSQFISGANGNIEISSSNFHLDTVGNVNLSGTITATAGAIAGFDIDGTKLKQGTSFYLDGNSSADYFISSSRFQVTPSGNVTASNLLASDATFKGVSTAESFEYQAVLITKDNSGSYFSTYTANQSIPVPDVGNVTRTRTFYKLDLTGANVESANYIVIDPAMELRYPIGRIEPSNTGTEYGQFLFIETGYINSSISTGRQKKYFTRISDWYDSSPTANERISIKGSDRGLFGDIWTGHSDTECIALGTLVANHGIQGFSNTTGWTLGPVASDGSVSVESRLGYTALKLTRTGTGDRYAQHSFTTEEDECYAFRAYYSAGDDPSDDTTKPYIQIYTGGAGGTKTYGLPNISWDGYKYITGVFRAGSGTTSKIRLGNDATGGGTTEIWWGTVEVGPAYTDTYIPLSHQTMLWRRSAYTGWSLQSIDDTSNINLNVKNIDSNLQIQNINGASFIDLATDHKYTDFGSRIIRNGNDSGDGHMEIVNRGTGSIRILSGYWPTTDNGRDSSIRLSAGYENDVILDKEALFPDINLDLDLGKPGKRWHTLYVQNQSIYFGSGSVNTAILSFNTGSNELEFRHSERTGAFNPIRVSTANFGDSASFEGAGSVQIGQDAQGFVAVNALPGQYSTILRAEASVLSGDQRMGSITQKSSGSFAILLDADDSQANRSKFVVESNSAIPGVGTRLFSVSESGETRTHGYLIVSQSVTADSFIGSLSNMTGTVDGGSF